MFGFGRKKVPKGGAGTFVEATGDSWGEPPEVVAVDGGQYADYVAEFLHRASEYAQANVAIGEEFEFTMTNIPQDIVNPYEISFGIVMMASKHGLSPGLVHGKTAHFTRVK